MGRGSDGPGKEAHGETGRGTGRLARAANRDAAIQPRGRRGLFMPWHATTAEAARALGRLDTVGTLEPGKRCDLAIWNVGRPAELVYRMGFNPLWRRVHHGELGA